MTEATASIVNWENNERAILLSEEIDFLESLLQSDGLPGEIVWALVERRDYVRAALKTPGAVRPADSAEEGFSVPNEDVPSDEYDPEDEAEMLAPSEEDDDDD